MITKGQSDKFGECVIAQADTCDYSESGYVAVVDGNWAAITSYSHCSCFDTWASITGGGISDDEGPNQPRWDWEGTVREMVALARRKGCLAIPGREADTNDCDYGYLMSVYAQIVEWNDKRTKAAKKAKTTKAGKAAKVKKAAKKGKPK